MLHLHSNRLHAAGPVAPTLLRENEDTCTVRAQVDGHFAREILCYASLTLINSGVLTAVSPTWRLCVELLVDSRCSLGNSFTAYGNDGRARYVLTTKRPGFAHLPIFSIEREVFAELRSFGRKVCTCCDLSLWWVERSGLPLVVRLDNNESTEALRLLSDELRSRVEELHVQLGRSERLQCSASWLDGVTASFSRQCKTVMCVLPTFASLRKLTISADREAKLGAMQQNCFLLALCLATATHQSLCEVTVEGIYASDVLDHLGAMPSMQKLSVTWCSTLEVVSLTSWACPSTIDVSYNRRLSSLLHCCGATSLATLFAHHCDLRRLDRLGDCCALRNVDVSHNAHLSTLADLAGSRCLSEVRADFCDLRQLQSLRTCAQLTSLHISGNTKLRSLSGLAGAPRLTTFVAVGCDLMNVAELGSCPELADVDVSDNIGLTEVRGIAGASNLRVFKARRCSLHTLDGLGQCRMLSQVDVSRNAALQRLNGLAGAEMLIKLTAPHCDVRDLSGLEGCARLSSIDVSSNARLDNLSLLALNLSVTHVNAAKCDLNTLRGLSACRQLTEIDVSNNTALQSLAPLAGLMRLKRIMASSCNIQFLNGLHTCAKLTFLFVPGNRQLRSLSELAGAPSLLYVDASFCNVDPSSQLDGCPEARVVTQ